MRHTRPSEETQGSRVHRPLSSASWEPSRPLPCSGLGFPARSGVLNRRPREGNGNSHFREALRPKPRENSRARSRAACSRPRRARAALSAAGRARRCVQAFADDSPRGGGLRGLPGARRRRSVRGSGAGEVGARARRSHGRRGGDVPALEDPQDHHAGEQREGALPSPVPRRPARVCPEEGRARVSRGPGAAPPALVPPRASLFCGPLDELGPHARQALSPHRGPSRWELRPGRAGPGRAGREGVAGWPARTLVWKPGGDISPLPQKSGLMRPSGGGLA